ncbi:MAG: energy-coupling factor transporter transmembrane component T [Dehalococcoidia bacterium]
MHPGAWAAWVAFVMTVALVTSNPLYLGIVLLCVVLVGAVAPREGGAGSITALAIFGAGMLAISLVVAVVNGSYGDHILFTVPGPNVPSWLGGLRLGGPVSAEGLAAAGIRGLAILCVFAAFGVLNAAVSPQRLLRAAPVSLFHAGLVVTIGLALLPSSLDDLRRLREIRALRGAPGGWRELRALVVPAITGGLERSMRLAEAMEARGFAAGTAPRSGQWAAGAGVVALTAAAGCWYYYPDVRPMALVLALAGAAGLTAWAVLQSRAHHTTRLEVEVMGRADRLGGILSVAGVAVVFGLNASGALEFGYNPFAGLPWPELGLAEAVAVLLVAWPVPVVLAKPGPRPEPVGAVFEGRAEA